MNNKPFFACLFSLLILLSSCRHDPVNYLAENQEHKDTRMAWWEEARFGMFIHWGLYAIPAGEWNGETNHAEWIRTTARIPYSVYDEFTKEFNPVKYDPDAWVRTARDAGMKYIVITSKHHDGFCLFDSKQTEFDVMSTPYQKDILDQLATACRKEGLKLCFYYSIMDWHHPDYIPRRGWETDRSSDDADFERYTSYLKAQIKEIMENYGDIGVLWFDGEWEETWTHERGKELYNYVRNLDPDIIINNRVDVGRSGMAGLTRPGEYAGDFGTPEQEIPPTGLPGIYWETCMTMNDHWGFNKRDTNWKNPGELIRKLSDIASKGGNFLLNVGPEADGSFPTRSVEILGAIGDWMNVYGDAIYGTAASPFKTLDFGRCTQKALQEDTRLYLHVFNWPANGILKVPGIYNSPEKAFLLDDPARDRLDVYRKEDALFIRLPDQAPNPVNSIVVLDILGKADISNPPVIDSENGIFVDLISINISSERENVQIRYTLDGSLPDTSSPMADGAIILRNSARIIARCFRDGEPVSDTTATTIYRVEPLPALQPEALVPGLYCEYYEGRWDSLPDFASLQPMKQIEVDAFTLEARNNNDHYGFLFEGYIDLPEDGVYEFYTDSDDGSQLFLNDRLVVDNDGLHGAQMAKGVIPLSKGLHKIKVTYFERDGNDNLNIYYDGPGFERKPVPAKALFRSKKK